LGLISHASNSGRIISIVFLQDTSYQTSEQLSYSLVYRRDELCVARRYVSHGS